ncbi:hypothetical protein B0H14DRAFT_3151216 [Mycena olivaceomarginata]|nr:hypothetical protein B0H14DRAFT_3151216 [Mycena olivaceomarginata]
MRPGLLLFDYILDITPALGTFVICRGTLGTFQHRWGWKLNRMLWSIFVYKMSKNRAIYSAPQSSDAVEPGALHDVSALGSGADEIEPRGNRVCRLILKADCRSRWENGGSVAMGSHEICDEWENGVLGLKNPGAPEVGNLLDAVRFLGHQRRAWVLNIAKSFRASGKLIKAGVTNYAKLENSRATEEREVKQES